MNHNFGLLGLAGKRVFFFFRKCLEEELFHIHVEMHSYKAVNAVIPFAQRRIEADLLNPATTPTLDCTAKKGCQLCRLLQNADVAALIRRFFLFDAFFVKEPSPRLLQHFFFSRQQHRLSNRRQ